MVPVCEALLTGFLPEDKGPYARTLNTVELIPILGTLSPRGGPVQDTVLTVGGTRRLCVCVREREREREAMPRP